MFMIFYLTINNLGKGALFSVVLIFCACISMKKRLLCFYSKLFGKQQLSWVDGSSLIDSLLDAIN